MFSRHNNIHSKEKNEKILLCRQIKLNWNMELNQEYLCNLPYNAIWDSGAITPKWTIKVISKFNLGTRMTDIVPKPNYFQRLHGGQPIWTAE